uniref:Cdkn1a interacting zinc finger protein 1b n=1 Tax=Cyprinus carpio TaxID=7962 RepID=A0A8C1YHD8_CYPCA
MHKLCVPSHTLNYHTLGTVGQIHSSVPEKGEPPLKKHRVQRSINGILNISDQEVTLKNLNMKYSIIAHRQKKMTTQEHSCFLLCNRERRMGHQRWCPTCQCHFSGDLIEHRRTKRHKMAKVSSRPFCTLCECHFRTPRKFVEHMKSPEHKQRVEELRNEGGPEVMEELITVDAIGCFEGEDDYEEDRNEEEIAVFEKHPAHREYDPDTHYGTSFVIPVTGFLCKLCHKFYNFESSARETHCRSLMHFQNLQHNTLKMQKKAPQDDRESDVSCSSPLSDPRGLELTASCASDSSQPDLNRPHINFSRERLHLRKPKPSKRPPKSKSPCSKNSVAPQNPAVVMKHLICTPHCGSGSRQESHYQESNRPDSSVAQRICVQ